MGAVEGLVVGLAISGVNGRFVRLFEISKGDKTGELSKL